MNIPNSFSNKAHKQELISRGYNIVDLINLPLEDEDYVRYFIVSSVNDRLIYTQCAITSSNCDVLYKLIQSLDESFKIYSLSFIYNTKLNQFVRHQVFNKSIYKNNRFFAYHQFDFEGFSHMLCERYKDTDTFLKDFEKFNLDKYLFEETTNLDDLILN